MCHRFSTCETAKSRLLTALIGGSRRGILVNLFAGVKNVQTYCVLIFFIACMLSLSAVADSLYFNIPRQNAGEALPLFGQQADVSVVYQFDQVEGHQTNRLEGDYSLAEAVDILLKDTGLKVRFSDSRHLIITISNDPEMQAMITKTSTLQKTFLAGLFGALFGAGAQSGMAQGTGSLVLEEVIVTAQKRGESLQSVPVAVSAFDAGWLENAGITTSEDLGMLVPSLVYNSSQNGGSAYMRGIGTKDTQPSGEPLVAMYVDGFYYQSFEAGLFNMSNIERIEVLRGPQGTLYGRNATAGLIHIITKQPEYEPGLDATIGLGNYGLKTTNLYGTAGISNSLAADLSVYYEKHDGWGTNLTTGEKANYRDGYALRSKWVWDASDDTLVTFAFDNSSWKGEIGNSGYLAPGTTAADGSVLDYSPYDTVRDVSSHDNYKHMWGIGFKVEHDMGWASFNSLTSYREQHSLFTVDPDNTGAVIVGVTINSQAEAFMQELQLISNDNKSFEWSAGLFYQYAGGGPEPISVQLKFLGPDVYAYQGRFSNAHTQSLAAYFQGTKHLTDALSATIGLRYTRDEQVVEAVGGGLNFTRQKESWSEPTYRFAVDYAFTDNVMGYLSLNRGYKNGRFSVTAPTNPAVNPEIVDTYEVGLKTELFDHRLRLNADVFYSDYTDLQVEVVVPPNVTPEIINAAEATIIGFEADMLAALTDNLTLSAGVTYLAEAEYDKFEGAQVVVPASSGMGNETVTLDLGGADLRFSPELVYTLGINYAVMTAVGEWSFNLNYRHNDEYLFEDALMTDAYDVLGARASWTSVNERWGVSLWGKNLTDELYNIGSNQDEFAFTFMPAAPRTYGVDLSVSF